MIGLAALAPYRYLVFAAIAAMALGGAYLRGRGDGHAAEAVQWQKREIDRQAQAAIEREQLQASIDAQVAERAARQQEAADAATQIRVEYLPAKTIVKREVVERPVFRECRVGHGLLGTLNAALRGTPTAGAPFDSGADGVPGGVGTSGG